MTETLTRWELLDFDPGAGLAAGAQHGRGEGWIPVAAPGDTYKALTAAGRLAHPFFGRNEAAAAWVRDREWWWRTRFEPPSGVSADEVVELVFEGLDTFASVYLDGQLLGRADNMFRPYVFDVSEASNSGAGHTLAICFHPPAIEGPAIALPVWSAFNDRVSRSRRNLMRKAQFGWGWDWGPDLPTTGIWRPVHVRRRPAVGIADLSFTTLSIGDAEAQALLKVEMDGDVADKALRLMIALADPDGRVVVQTEAACAATIALDLVVAAPRLWWSAGLGPQPLYTLTVRLIEGDRILDERQRRIGVRTITLDTSPDPDEPGTSFFRFMLNGRPLFAKGACWIPPTSFVAEVDPALYRRLLEQAAGANMNMIRVWGGGVYEPDVFYDLCDELGLLVWQDFMFACAHYPDGDEAFTASVRAEVEHQVLRLRDHACLALWCGNNESQAMHRINADLSGDPAALSGASLYDDLMPAILGRVDPSRPYWPGSPEGGPNPNSMQAGDVHDWTVWHGVPPIPEADMVGGFDSTPEGVAYTRYAQDTGRFISEFGIQAAPSLEMLQRWMAPEDLALGSDGFLERVKDEARKADAMMLPVTGLPSTLQDYVDFTMWTQAEGLKFGIEHFRRRSPHCSGALIWQFNDCWPCVSWSLVDFDGGEKAGYHAVRRAFAPVLASFRALGDDRYELWITNDTHDTRAGQAVVELHWPDGRTVWRREARFQAPPGSQAMAWTGSVPPDEGQILTVRSHDEAFPPNRHLLAPISQLNLDGGARPNVRVHSLSGHTCQLDISATTYLPFVHLTSTRADLAFSDNYFDLMAGESRRVTVTGSGDVSLDDVAVRCWNEKASSNG